MDLHYDHQTIIYVLNACHDEDAADLIALGGDHSVEIIAVTDAACISIASFHVGMRITAVAWSPKTISPSNSDNWVIELVAATSDFGLHVLTKVAGDDETVFSFGGGLSGHHGQVTDMVFCGGRGSDSSRYVATVSDDKMLMIWDLQPPNQSPPDPSTSTGSPDSQSRAQPTAYVIPFPHPLTSVNSHPTSSKEFLVSDCRGSIFLTDWRSDPDDPAQGPWHHSSLIELVEPYALAESSRHRPSQLPGSVAWQRESADLIGAVYGSRFSLWDISRLQGGKPFATGSTFVDGGNRFRWCYTYPDYFAISTPSPTKGAVIDVHNVNYLHSQPSSFTVAPRPHIIRDFDFLSLPGIPRLAVAIARSVKVFPIGVDTQSQ